MKKLISSLIIGSTLFGSLLTSTVEASNFSWKDLWNTSSEERSRTFTNVKDSGIDVTVEYSTSQAWQVTTGNRQKLNLFEKKRPFTDPLNKKHQLWLYDGALRVTNHMNWITDRPQVTINFSESVDLKDFWLGDLSLHTGRSVREWAKFTAYDEAGNIIAPDKVAHYEDFYGTTCPTTRNSRGSSCFVRMADNPNFVDILPQSDGSVLLKGLGHAQQYGRVFFAASGVSKIEVEFLGTNALEDVDADEISEVYAAVPPRVRAVGAIGNLFDFELEVTDDPPASSGNVEAVRDSITFRADESAPFYNVLSNDLNTGSSSLFVDSINGEAITGTDKTITLASGSQIIVAASGEVDYQPNPALTTLLVGDSNQETFNYTIIGEDGVASTAEVVFNMEGYLYAD